MMATRREILVGAAGAIASASGLRFAGAQTAPVKIGFSISQSGGLAGGGRSALLGRQIWRDDVNKKGGLLGRPIDLVFYDDQSSPTVSPGIYAKLFDIDKIDIPICPYGALLTASVMPMLAQRGMLAFANFASGVNDKLKYDRFFEAAPFGDELGGYSGGFIKLAAKNGLKSIAILSVDFEATQQIVASIKELIAHLGMNIVYDQRYPLNTVEFSPLLRALKSKSPEAVFVVSYPNESAAIVRAVNEVGVGSSVQLFGGNMIGLQFAPLLESLGSQLNGIVNYQTYVPEPTLNAPGVSEFFAIYAAQAREAKVDPLGFYLAPINYALCQIIEQSVATAGTLDNASIAQQMRKMSFKTILGDVKFGPTGQWDKPRMLQIQFQDIKANDIEQFRQRGRQVILDPPEFASGSLRKPFSTART
jgi:branched-chain amino acid transport system substrate-binding protein